jgi:Ca2+-binding EF-hand superfamily protein
MKISTSALLLLTSFQVATGFVSPLTTTQRSHAAKYQHPDTAFVLPRTTMGLLVTATPAIQEEADEIETIHHDADVVFSIIDVDGNGQLSREELTEHLSAAGYNLKVIDTIFNKMDLNKDNEISQEEFRRGMVVLKPLQNAPGLGRYNASFEKEIHEDADQVFQSADADRNGEIDVLELKSHLQRKFGRSYTEQAIENLFRMLDFNGDKRISKQELRDAFVRYSALRQVIGEGPNYK